MPLYVFTPAFVFLLSCVCTKWTTYHTKAKSWRRLFHMSKRLHNVILSALCTHPRTHKLGCRWREVPHVHTPYSHCLSRAYSNTLWACADRQIQTYTSTHSPMTAPHPPCRRQAGPSGPWGQRDRKTEKEISGPSDVCVIYTPTPSSFFLSDPTFPQFQAANSAVCQVHFQSLECTCKHSSHLYLPVHLCSHTSHLRNDTWKLFVTSYKLKHQTHEDTLNEASPSQQSHLLRAKLYINMSCRITRWLWKCHLKNASSHKDIRTVLNTHSEMKYSTWWSIKTGSRPFWLVQHFVCTLYTCTALPFSSGPYCPHSIVLFVYFV